MPKLLFDLLAILPQTAMLFAQATFMPVRNVKLLVIVATSFSVMCAAAKSLFLGIAPGYILGTIANLVPVLFYRQDVRWSQRWVAVALGIVLMMVGEVAASAVWILSGATLGDYADVATRPFTGVLVHVIDAIVIIIGAYLLRPMMRRWFTRSAGYRGGAIMSLLPVSHAAFFLLLAEIGFIYLPGNSDYSASLTLLTAACLAVDALMVVTMDRYRMGQLERQRAEALEGQLNACLSGYAGLAAQVEEASHLRHDLRNHLQVAGALVERGDLERAGAYIADVAQTVRGVGSGEVDGASGAALGSAPGSAESTASSEGVRV